MSRSRLLGAAVAGVAVVAALALGWVWFGQSSPPPPPATPESVTDPDVRAAIERARKAVLAAPRDAGAWGTLGMTLYAHRCVPEAKAALTVAHTFDPTDARWPYLLGHLALTREPEAAVPLLREAAEWAGPDTRPAARLQLAEALANRQESDEAERLFRERLASGADPRASLGLGRILLARDDLAGAARAFRDAAGGRSLRKSALSQLALVARLQGDEPAARRYDEEARGLPDDPPGPDPFLAEVGKLRVGRQAAINRATELGKEGRVADSVALLARLARETGDPEVMVRLGTDLNLLGECDKAATQFEAALKLTPDDAAAHHGLGYALIVLADRMPPDRKQVMLREAAAHLTRAAELKLEDGLSLVYLGQVQAALGDKDAAVATLERAVANRPDLPEAHLALLLTLEKQGKADAARARLADAARVVPADDAALRSLRERLAK